MSESFCSTLKSIKNSMSIAIKKIFVRSGVEIRGRKNTCVRSGVERKHLSDKGLKEYICQTRGRKNTFVRSGVERRHLSDQG